MGKSTLLGGKSFNDLILGDTSLRDVATASASLGFVVKGVSRSGGTLENNHDTSTSGHTDLHRVPSFVKDGDRFIHGSRVIALKPTSVDGATLGLRKYLHKASSIVDVIPVSRLHLKVGYDIISNDPINSFNDKRIPFLRPSVLEAILPPYTAQSGYSLGSSLAASPSFANMVTGLTQGQIGVNGSASSFNVLNSKDSLIAP
ncbi:hypothetical protein PanWU01x14_021540 [Parasponia andersonii]|uniref:Uncharacterized protein n=1 Tax=Parasponia andersonii TaxID=3476 RepID=A0A2P5DXZ8_PARAD|nr:hypothetical protein PanWU01x14_021540 [Parasponia andersonii]